MGHHVGVQVPAQPCQGVTDLGVGQPAALRCRGRAVGGQGVEPGREERPDGSGDAGDPTRRGSLQSEPFGKARRAEPGGSGGPQRVQNPFDDAGRQAEAGGGRRRVAEDAVLVQVREQERGHSPLRGSQRGAAEQVRPRVRRRGGLAPQLGPSDILRRAAGAAPAVPRGPPAAAHQRVGQLERAVAVELHLQAPVQLGDGEGEQFAEQYLRRRHSLLEVENGRHPQQGPGGEFGRHVHRIAAGRQRDHGPNTASRRRAPARTAVRRAPMEPQVGGWHGTCRRESE